MGWFSPKFTPGSIRVDVHSHLVPSVDDGVADMQDALDAIRELKGLGYSGAVTTPHIWSERFPNVESELRIGFEELREAAAAAHPGFALGLGAEYMLDDVLVDRLYEGADKLLTFGGDERFLLVEFHPITEPLYASELIDECARQHVKPIIAHVERYRYIQRQSDHAYLQGWRDRGALIQVNIGSFAGRFGTQALKYAKRLLKEDLIHLLGTDMHRPKVGDRFMPKAWKYLGRKGEGFDVSWHEKLLPDA